MAQTQLPTLRMIRQHKLIKIKISKRRYQRSLRHNRMWRKIIPWTRQNLLRVKNQSRMIIILDLLHLRIKRMKSSLNRRLLMNKIYLYRVKTNSRILKKLLTIRWWICWGSIFQWLKLIGQWRDNPMSAGSQYWRQVYRDRNNSHGVPMKPNEKNKVKFTL